MRTSDVLRFGLFPELLHVILLLKNTTSQKWRIGLMEAPTTPPPAASRTSGKAIASLILSLLGLVGVLPLIGSILGIIFGNQAKGEIARSGGDLAGEGLAQAGVIIGWVGLALNVIGTICVLLYLGGIIGLGICSALTSGSLISR
jgi:hypothetical protein